MGQRNSGYERQAGDAYWTPQWVFDVLYDVEDFSAPSDCAPREPEYDFLGVRGWLGDIVTNPPFSQADAFIRHALDLTKHQSGKVAMLLPHAFDTAKGRRDLWDLPFKAKYTLTRRIRWENLEQKKNGPSSNHAWYVWHWQHVGPAQIGWL
jgi:hypothetical protein